MKRILLNIGVIVALSLGLSLAGCSSGMMNNQPNRPQATSTAPQTFTGTVARTAVMHDRDASYDVFLLNNGELPFVCSFDAICASLKEGDKVEAVANQRHVGVYQIGGDQYAYYDVYIVSSVKLLPNR